MAYQDIVSKVSGIFGDGKAVKNREKKQNERDLIATIERNYASSRTAKEATREKWIEYIKLWRGDHWNKFRAAYKSSTVENICFSIVEAMVPLLGDRQPQINFLPQTEDDIEAATQLNEVSSYTWNADKMDEKMPRILRDMLILGTSIVKMRWDTEKFNGMGDLTADVIDPFLFFPDDEATEFDEMDWCILKTKISIKKIKKMYGKEVLSDHEYNDSELRPTDTYEQKASKSKNLATVIEYWYKDEDGNTRVAVYSNGELLDDKETPYETNDFPFIAFYDHKLTGEFWGISTLEPLAPLQKELNKVRSMIMDNMIATNNTIIVVDSNSGVKAKDIRNEPGLIIEKNPGGKIERLAPPHLPAHFQGQIEITKQAMQEVSGVHDVSKGIVQGQVAAASAIQILTENSQTRLRSKLRNVENSIKRIAGWYLLLIRQFYTEPRIIRLSGEEEAFKFVEFDGRNLRAETPIMDPNTGQPTIDPETGEPQTEILLTDFDIRISSGSSMMMNKSAKFQQLFEMHQNNLVDLETVLTAADIGNPKEIMQRMISEGKLPDPNQPKVDIKKVLGDLGVKVNLTTNDPDNVLNALTQVQQQLDAAQQQGMQIPGDMGQQMTQLDEFQNIIGGNQ